MPLGRNYINLYRLTSLTKTGLDTELGNIASNWNLTLHHLQVKYCLSSLEVYHLVIYLRGYCFKRQNLYVKSSEHTFIQNANCSVLIWKWEPMNWKVTNLCSFRVSHVLKLLIYQAKLCNTIILYIGIKNKLRSDYTPVCWYLFIDLNGSWFGLQNLWILLSDKNVYSVFLLLNQEGMHAWIFSFLF